MKHWIKTEEQLPFTWETGDWDGKRSNQVLVKDEKGEHFVATYYEFPHGDTEWYDRDDFSLRYKVVMWMEIPIY